MPPNQSNRPRTQTAATLSIPRQLMRDMIASQRPTIEISCAELDTLIARTRRFDPAEARRATILAMIASEGIPPEACPPLVSRAGCVMLSRTETADHDSISVAEVVRELEILGLSMRAHGCDLLVGETIVRFPAADRVTVVELRRKGETTWQPVPAKALALVLGAL